MAIPLNVNKYITKKLAKIFRLDFDALHEGLHMKGFFTGEKVNMDLLNISTYRVEKSSLLQDLVLVGFMTIEHEEYKVKTIQLTEKFIRHLSAIGPLNDQKDIKHHIQTTIRTVKDNNYMDNVRLFKELIDAHLPAGYEFLAHNPWYTVLNPFDFIIVQVERKPMDFFKDIEKIYAVASYVHVISKRHVVISIEESLMGGDKGYFKQYSVTLKFVDKGFNKVFNDPNFKNTKLALLEERLNQNN